MKQICSNLRTANHRPKVVRNSFESRQKFDDGGGPEVFVAYPGNGMSANHISDMLRDVLSSVGLA